MIFHLFLLKYPHEWFLGLRAFSLFDDSRSILFKSTPPEAVKSIFLSLPGLVGQFTGRCFVEGCCRSVDEWTTHWEVNVCRR